jgi:thiamine pyrophosphokinase
MLGIGFIGGEGPEPEQRVALAKAGDLIAAADSGLMAAEAAGIRPDWIVGDMDSLDDLRRLDRYPADRVRTCPRDKDDTDTELLLSLLWEQGCGEVWLIGGGGGRTDHLLAVQALFERDRSPDRWITAAEDIRQVRDVLSLKPTGNGQAVSSGEAAGGGQVSVGEAAPGSLVSVFPLGTGPWEAESRGLKWPLAGLPWKRGFFGVSNVALTGDVVIRAIQGRFLVILPLNPGIQ